MTRTSLPWSRRRTTAVAATGVLAVVAAGLVAPTGASGGTLSGASATNLNLLGAPIGLEDFDGRTGTVAPSATQQSVANSLGASVRWNRYGTPQSLINHNGFLASGLTGTDAEAARSFLRSKAALFRLTAAQVDALELLNDSRLSGNAGHVVLFRQKFGSLPAAVDGMVTVAITGGKVAYVSSSIAPTTAAPGGASLSATAAWLKAAANVGRVLGTSSISGVRTDARTGWTVFKVAGLAQEQQVRLRALPTYAGAVRPVFEVNVVDAKDGAPLAYTSYVDAQSGVILVRHNQVDQATENDTFSGAVTATECGPLHSFTVDEDTKTIVVTANEAIPTNDIVLKLLFMGEVVASSDQATSPEAIAYSQGGDVPAGIYQVQVCPFPNPTTPFTEPGDYVGTFTASDQGAAASVPYPPAWKYFLANPVLDFSATSTTDSRKIGCWVSVSMNPACNNPPSPLINLAARGPWDYNFRTNTPTFTTEGNAAVTAESWTSFLTPSAPGQRPVSPNRHYGFDNPAQDFTDAWNNNKCSQAAFTAANNNNDILASTTSLFSNHNRIHDWSYFLGFTEGNYNLQDNNFGNRAMGGVSPTGGEGDPEVGNVQAGAVTFGAPTYMGRDNANQITLQDGIPGITNQYLFQPIAGAFYAPCTDGDYDMTVIGHEYNHAISNRMVGGPDANLMGFQAGSMGESWGDQVALEYLFEHNYSTGAGTAVEGPYVTGNKKTGIRNYALDNNPLQYGDLGYDITGPEVHADGEPWSAVMWDVRKALITKYNGAYPVSNTTLQRRCAQGGNIDKPSANTSPEAPLDAKFCPGNRRWMQMLFDAYLLQAPATSMLDARDAMLAADRMRFGGANQAVMWNAYAKRGFGFNAKTNTNEDDQPTPDYTSPYATEGTLQISAQAFDENGPGAMVAGTLFVGQYEARITPVADTNPSGGLPSSVKMVPGTYQFLFQAPGYGLRRFTETIGAGQTVARTLHLSKNLASSFSGGTVTGFTPGVVNADKLIDDTESTNFAALTQTAGVQNTKPFVTVKLAGGTPSMVRSVQVSALLRPPPGQDESEPQPDMSTQSRFTALRQFQIDVCTQSGADTCAAGGANGTLGWRQLYVSAANAFPSTVPRPLVPDLNIRTFNVDDTMATHVRLVALQNQCTGTPEYSGEQDNDPLNATDCVTASNKDEQVRAAELEVFGFDSGVRPPGDPVVVTTMTAPASARAGSEITYNISYTNLGPAPSSNATITDQLPAGLTFVAASTGGSYNGATRTVKWGLGTVGINATGTVTLVANVAAGTPVGTVILNQAQFAGAMTFSPPAAASTLVVP